MAVGPVSAVSMCRKSARVAVETPPGMATSWYSVSVCVVPWPPSQASQVPEFGGSEADELITPPAMAHGAGFDEPFSNPGLPRSCVPDDAPVASAASSTTKDVWSVEFSTAWKYTRMVWPAYELRSKAFGE